jgi:peptidoglycan/xylan/chitin deacetylase (PgdA/CDA1 family)
VQSEIVHEPPTIALPDGRFRDPAFAVKPLLLALRSKGPVDLSKRALAITTRYGISSAKMLEHLEMLFRIVDENDARATLPVTASAASRHPALVKKLGDRGIEFAVHGYDHVDHREMSEDEQVEAFHRGREALARAGVTSTGFRAPYLRWSEATLAAVSKCGFDYDSSQAFHWPVPDLNFNEAYHRVLDFCGSLPAEPRTIRPWIEDGMLRIPYSLPDDEALVDRLKIEDPEAIASCWLYMWARAHERGDLFTLGIHPERIGLCGYGVGSVLAAARSAEDPVWVATLDEISAWWRARAAASLEVRRGGEAWNAELSSAPKEAVLTSRGVDVEGAPSWPEGFVAVSGATVSSAGPVRPVVGIHPSAPPDLVEFVRAEGFVTEMTDSQGDASVFIERDVFSSDEEQGLLEEILDSSGPLVRLARWPGGARSALAISGDVDAFTLWDYLSRLTQR